MRSATVIPPKCRGGMLNARPCSFNFLFITWLKRLPTHLLSSPTTQKVSSRHSPSPPLLFTPGFYQLSVWGSYSPAAGSWEHRFGNVPWEPRLKLLVKYSCMCVSSEFDDWWGHVIPWVSPDTWAKRSCWILRTFWSSIAGVGSEVRGSAWTLPLPHVAGPRCVSFCMICTVCPGGSPPARAALVQSPNLSQGDESQANPLSTITVPLPLSGVVTLFSFWDECSLAFPAFSRDVAWRQGGSLMGSPGGQEPWAPGGGRWAGTQGVPRSPVRPRLKN